MWPLEGNYVWMRVGPPDGIGAFIRRDTRDFALSLPCEDTGGRQLSASQKEDPALKQTMAMDTLQILGINFILSLSAVN